MIAGPRSPSGSRTGSDITDSITFARQTIVESVHTLEQEIASLRLKVKSLEVRIEELNAMRIEEVKRAERRIAEDISTAEERRVRDLKISGDRHNEDIERLLIANIELEKRQSATIAALTVRLEAEMTTRRLFEIKANDRFAAIEDRLESKARQSNAQTAEITRLNTEATRLKAEIVKLTSVIEEFENQ